MSLLLLFVGDSLTYGTGSTTPSTDSYGAQMGSAWYHGATVIVDGHPGATVAGITSATVAGAKSSGSFDGQMAIVVPGTNDVFQGTLTTAADLVALQAALIADGFTGSHGAIVWGALPPWAAQPSGWSPTAAAAINAFIKAQPFWMPTDVTPEWALVSGGTDYDGVNRIAVGNSNAGHGTTLGYAAWARDGQPAVRAAAASLGLSR